MRPVTFHSNKREIKPVFSLALLFVVFLTVSACNTSETDTLDETMDETMDQMDTMVESSDERSLTASLSGSSETTPEGSGNASVTIDTEAGEVCYEIDYENIEEPTIAHIHRGSSTETGGVAVNFNVPENGWSGCVEGVGLTVINDILGSPENYYVNVHNGPYPAGVIRGQLMSDSDE